MKNLYIYDKLINVLYREETHLFLHVLLYLKVMNVFFVVYKLAFISSIYF